MSTTKNWVKVDCARKTQIFEQKSSMYDALVAERVM